MRTEANKKKYLCKFLIPASSVSLHFRPFVIVRVRYVEMINECPHKQNIMEDGKKGCRTEK